MKSGALALMCLAAAGCTGEPGIPVRPDGPLLDQADILSAAEEQRLRRLLQETGQPIMLASVDTLGERSIDAYANVLFSTWGIGDASQRGALILMAPNEREVRIHVGCGLEAWIPDAVAFEILNDRMKPFLSSENYAAAAYIGIEALAAQMAAPPPRMSPGPRHEACLEQQGELV